MAAVMTGPRRVCSSAGSDQGRFPVAAVRASRAAERRCWSPMMMARRLAVQRWPAKPNAPEAICFSGGGEVGVGGEDGGVVAAEFGLEGDAAAGGDFAQGVAGVKGAGERDGIDGRVGGGACGGFVVAEDKFDGNRGVDGLPEVQETAGDHGARGGRVSRGRYCRRRGRGRFCRWEWPGDYSRG